jgi:MoaA/NifB/PqqE/SkfB family radical SAM enzyme
VEELINVWKKIYDMYGECKISITGGEPLYYPNFIKFIKELCKYHKVQVITNLSLEIDELLYLSHNNLQISPSFHPLFADEKDFINKVLKLKEKGFTNGVSYVAWPGQIKNINLYKKIFNKEGIDFYLQSFFGEYQGKKYPENYSEEEKEIILPFLGKRGNEKFQTEKLVTKGKLCNAGVKYGVIHPDGTVLTCGGITNNHNQKIIGNIFDKNFKLLEKPRECISDLCPCNEWAFLLVK